MYWWLIGGAAWYATAAVAIRQLPRGSIEDDEFFETFFRALAWLLSPVVVAFGIPAAFAYYVLTPRETRK